MNRGPYNPLDKINIAKSIESELWAGKAVQIEGCSDIKGAGVYVIYYTGPFAPYAPISIKNKGGKFEVPIYIGKAIPKGGRKGGLAADLSGQGRALADRLRQHADSIKQTRNLEKGHFHVRYLLVDDIWIPLGENVLIENFKPVWNQVIDGVRQ